MKKSFMTLIALMLACLLVLSGCGKDSGKVPALKKGESLELTKWSMSATAWSSPNGATVNLTATPNGYAEGQSAVFCVRLEGDDIANVPCQWDGSVYTASADLNSADGYCYFVQLTAADGTQTEVAVNTPTAPIDDSLINMETALNAYCEADVTGAKQEGSDLILEKGTLKIQLPFLTLDTGAVTCQKAELVLSYDGTDVSSQDIKPSVADAAGICTADLSGIRFSVPSGLENGHQLGLHLTATLSNGHILSAPAGNWYYQDGQLILAVG